MQTKDLKVGMHIAWSYQSRNSYGENQEGFIMAFRPRTYSTGNNTVGIARTWGRYNNAEPSWTWEWVAPAQIKQTWAEELTERAERQENARLREAQAKRQQIQRKAQMDAIPQAFLTALGVRPDDINDYVRGYRSSFYINLDHVGDAFKVAQNSHPVVAAQIVADEVAAALALL